MAVRGLMRKDETDEALKTVLLFDFYSKDAPNREEGNLFDMQVATELVAFLFARRRTGVWLWRCYEKRQGAAVELSHTRSEYPLPRVRAFFRPAPHSEIAGKQASAASVAVPSISTRGETYVVHHQHLQCLRGESAFVACRIHGLPPRSDT